MSSFPRVDMDVCATATGNIRSRPQPSFAPTSSLSRRYACDRCRAHKLRCNRDLTAPTNNPCQRCHKAGADCTIGSDSSWKSARRRNRGALQGRSPVNQSIPGTISGAKTMMKIQTERIDAIAQRTEVPRAQMPSQASVRHASHEAMAETDESRSWAQTIHEVSDHALSLNSTPWQELFDPFSSLVNTNQDTTVIQALPTPTSPVITGPHKGAPNHRPKLSRGAISSAQIVAAPSLDMFSSDDHTGLLLGTLESSTTNFLSRKSHEQRPQSTDLTSCSEDRGKASDVQRSVHGEDDDSDDYSLWDDTPITLASFDDGGLQAITELCKCVLTDLRQLKQHKLVGSILVSQSDPQCANIIDRMLQNSERFLDIIKSFRISYPEPSTEFTEHLADIEIETSSSSAEQEGNVDFGVPQMESRQTSDLPCIFALLTCYTSIIDMFETVFSEIQQSITDTQSTNWEKLLPKTPSPVHGVHITGFALQNHRTLQLKLIIEISKYVLGSIEKALRDADVLENILFQSLLKTGLRQSGHMIQENSTEHGMGAVRRSLAQIERML